MSTVIDLTGQQFGRLTVLGRAGGPVKKGEHAVWLCACACGNKKEVVSKTLRSGASRSCGCLSAEKQARYWGKRRHAWAMRSSTWLSEGDP